jgi:hypothetical protein
MSRVLQRFESSALHLIGKKGEKRTRTALIFSIYAAQSTSSRQTHFLIKKLNKS